MMLPSLFSAITLIFAKCLGDFGVAYILGLPVKYEVLATSLYRAVVSRSPGVAAVLAGVVILLGLISVLIELRMVREANKFVTVGGKEHDGSRINPRKEADTCDGLCFLHLPARLSLFRSAF